MSLDGGWASGFTRRSFDVGGGAVSWLELADSEARSGVPIVMVHGMQGTALEYCELGRRLGGSGPVRLLDLRGHGRSSAAPANPIGGSLADQVDVVTAFLREIVGRPAVLVGNSFGAIVCAHVTRAAPEAVLRLVLIGPAVRPSRRPVDPRRILQWLVQKPQWVRDRYDREVRSGERPEDPDAIVANGTQYLDLVPAHYLEALRAEPEPAWSVDDPAGRVSLWRGRNDTVLQLARTRRWHDLLGTLEPPALWLHGADDRIMPAATAEELRDLLPGWEVDTIAATGHVPHLERVDWVAERIGTWLGSMRP